MEIAVGVIHRVREGRSYVAPLVRTRSHHHIDRLYCFGRGSFKATAYARWSGVAAMTSAARLMPIALKARSPISTKRPGTNPWRISIERPNAMEAKTPTCKAVFLGQPRPSKAAVNNQVKSP